MYNPDRYSEERKLKLCLGIISGRVNKENMDTDDYLDIGYDPYFFIGKGTPNENEIKHKAENIIIETLLKKGE